MYTEDKSHFTDQMCEFDKQVTLLVSDLNL